MLYKNELCPGCGQAMTEGSDIVVCPVCATPQHRACWQKENRCVNEALHAQAFVWSSQAPIAEPEPEMQADEAVCPLCHAQNSAGALHCERCGAPLGEPVPQFVRDVFNASSDEVIGGENAADIAIYVRSSVDRYLQRFRRFSQGGSGLSWNWAAFFFSPFWFFYRRMYKLGVFFVVMLATLTLITAIPLGDFQETYSGYYDELVSEETTDERLLEIEKVLLTDMKPVFFFFGLNLLLRAVCALVANKAYYKKTLADLKSLHEMSPDGEMFRFLLLQHGGTAPLGFAMGFFGYELLFQAMLYLSDKITLL